MIETPPTGLPVEDDGDRNTFGIWLGNALHMKGWRNIDLARAIGVEGSLISKWRKGSQRPDTLSCRLIAEALGVQLSEVLRMAGHLDRDVDLGEDEPIRNQVRDLVDVMPTSLLEPLAQILRALVGEQRRP